MPRLSRETFSEFVSKAPSGCWEWTGNISSSGYGVYNRKGAHRLSYELHKAPIPKGLFVCHACDNRRCVNPDHLWLGTQADNMRDMKEKGRVGFYFGSCHPGAKLSETQIAEIRALKGIETQASLASRFGVSSPTICNIQSGKRWTREPGAQPATRHRLPPKGAPDPNRAQGEAHGSAKLTESDVRAIRRSKLTRRALAALYGVSPTNIGLICNRRSWASVEDL